MGKFGQVWIGSVALLSRCEKESRAPRVMSAWSLLVDEASGAPQPTPKPATAEELVAGWCLYRDMYGKNGMAAGGAKSEKPEGSIRPPATPVTSEPADAADSTTPLTPRRCEIAMWAP